MTIKTLSQLYAYVTGLLNLDKKLTELPLLPEEYEFSGNELIYIVADDGKDYKIANKNIVIPQIANKADLVDGIIPIEQIPELELIAIDQLSGIELPQLVKKTASNNIRNTHNAEASTSNNGMIKLKTITLTKGLIGNQRFFFDIKSTLNLEEVFARIYRNGSPLGTLQSTTNNSFVTKTEDITQTWDAGDTCELWADAEDSVGLTVRNFRIAYDDNPTVAVPSTNS